MYGRAASPLCIFPPGTNPGPAAMGALHSEELREAAAVLGLHAAEFLGCIDGTPKEIYWAVPDAVGLVVAARDSGGSLAAQEQCDNTGLCFLDRINVI